MAFSRISNLSFLLLVANLVQSEKIGVQQESRQTRKFTRNCGVFTPLQKQFLYQFEYISILHLLMVVLRRYHSLTWNVLQDILPIFFFCLIQKGFVPIIHKFEYQGIRAPTRKPEVVLHWIFPQLYWVWGQTSQVFGSVEVEVN